MRARKNIYKNMCHKCHVSYSNANLGTASSLLERSAKVQLMFYKDNANREQRGKLAYSLCRGAAYLIQRYKFFGKFQRILPKNLWKVEFHCCCNSSILRFHNVCSSCCLGTR